MVSKFTYDGDGARVLQVQISGTQVMTTAYAGAIEVQITATQRITKAYYYAGSQLVAMRVYTSPTNSLPYYLLGDHLGSVNVTVDHYGNVLARQKFDAWGHLRTDGSTTGTMPTDVAFTGQREEDYINLYQMGARWYSPVLGRWLSPDTIVPDFSDPQSLNRFSYVRNNPINRIDPSGHIDCDQDSAINCISSSSKDKLRADTQNLRNLAEDQYGITFTGGGWDYSRIRQVVKAASAIGQRFLNMVTAHATRATRLAARTGDPTGLFRSLSMFDQWSTPGAIFRAIMGPIRFAHVNQDPGHWGFTRTTRQGEVIDVYNGAFAAGANFTFHFPAHELGGGITLLV